MNIQPSAIAPSVGQGAAPERPPLKKICCLLPIWGYAYVRKFLEVGLPSWLAEGNLPAMTRMVPTEFILLTSREDEIYLRAHPGFKRLSALCKTSFHFVDHLITGSNYSTTITLAYAEAIRAAGDDMLDTCFMFLVSDYIVANGSFRTVIERVQAGSNGILGRKLSGCRRRSASLADRRPPGKSERSATGASRVDEMGVVAFASGNSCKHRQLSADSQRPYQ